MGQHDHRDRPRSRRREKRAWIYLRRHRDREINRRSFERNRSRTRRDGDPRLLGRDGAFDPQPRATRNLFAGDIGHRLCTVGFESTSSRSSAGRALREGTQFHPDLRQRWFHFLHNRQVVRTAARLGQTTDIDGKNENRSRSDRGY